jgi:predicted DNA-binding protein
MKHTSVRLTDEQHRIVQSLADSDLVDSSSEAVRLLVDAGIDAVEDVREAIPEHERVLHRREQVVDRNRVEQLRGGFRSRLVEQFRDRFGNGWEPREVERVARGYHDEIDVLWPHDEDRRDELHEVVDDVLNRYREAWDDGEDPLADPFDAFGGVEAGRAERESQQRVDDELVETARRLLDRRNVTSPDRVVERLSERVDVDEAAADEAVRRASEAIRRAGGDV